MRDRVTIYCIVRKKFATVTKSGNIYYLNCIKQRITTNVVTTLKNEDTNEAIWHGRYHLGIKNSERPAKEHLVEELDCNVSKNATFCETASKTEDRRRAINELLGVAHSGVCGKIETKSLSGAGYFITFIGDRPRLVWVYMMKHKSKAFQTFLE